ncbi:MAG: hypothetical protein QXF58_00640 [Desulfurococcaceae archaeon]
MRTTTKLVNVMVEELHSDDFDKVFVADGHGLMTNIG